MPNYPPAGKKYFIHEDCHTCEHPREIHTASGISCEYENCLCTGYVGNKERVRIGKGGARDGAGMSKVSLQLERNGSRVVCDGVRINNYFITQSWTDVGPRGTNRQIINLDNGELIADGLDYHSALSEAKRLNRLVRSNYDY